MMLKSRVSKSVVRVNEWKHLEELKWMMQIEEEFMRKLGVDDVGYGKNERILGEVDLTGQYRHQHQLLFITMN